MRIKKAKLYIGDNQSPESYIKIGNRLLSGEDGGKPDIPLAYEAFEKAAEQKENREIRAQAALILGKIHYFGIGGFSDEKKMAHFLSVASLTACQLPCQKEIIRMVQIFWQPRPFDLQQVNRRGESPLQYAAKKGYMEMLELLFLLGAEAIIEKEVLGQTALFLACSNGRIAAIEYLLEKGAETCTRGALGASLLHAAVKANQKEVLELLLQKGLRVSSHCDDFGLTAFYCAVQIGRLQLASIMLSDPEYGAYVDEVGVHGWTPLHWAAFQGEVETAKFLIRNGAAINALTIEGDTPLHLAACMDNRTMVERLIRLGGNRTLRNRKNKLPMDYSPKPMPILHPEFELSEELSPSL